MDMKQSAIISGIQALRLGKIDGIFVSEGKEFNMFTLLKSRPIWVRCAPDIDNMTFKLSDLSMSKDIRDIHMDKGIILLMVEDCSGNTSNITAEVIEEMMKMVA